MKLKVLTGATGIFILKRSDWTVPLAVTVMLLFDYTQTLLPPPPRDTPAPPQLLSKTSPSTCSRLQSRSCGCLPHGGGARRRHRSASRQPRGARMTARRMRPAQPPSPLSPPSRLRCSTRTSNRSSIGRRRSTRPTDLRACCARRRRHVRTAAGCSGAYTTTLRRTSLTTMTCAARLQACSSKAPTLWVDCSPRVAMSSTPPLRASPSRRPGGAREDSDLQMDMHRRDVDVANAANRMANALAQERRDAMHEKENVDAEAGVGAAALAVELKESEDRYRS